MSHNGSNHTRTTRGERLKDVSLEKVERSKLNTQINGCLDDEVNASSKTTEIQRTTLSLFNSPSKTNLKAGALENYLKLVRLIL